MSALSYFDEIIRCIYSRHIVKFRKLVSGATYLGAKIFQISFLRGLFVEVLVLKENLHCKGGWIYTLKKDQPIFVSSMQLNCAVIERVSSH